MLFKQIAVVGLEVVVFGFAALAKVVGWREGGEEAGDFLQDGAAGIEDGGKVFAIGVDGGGVVVTYFLDDEIEGVVGVFDLEAVFTKVGEGLFVQEFDVLGLGGYVPYFAYRMEIAVDECVALVEVASVEGGAFMAVGLVFTDFLEPLDMHAGDSDAHAAHVHHETAVASDADDVAFDPGQGAGDDTEQAAVFGVIVKGSEQEADAVGVGAGHAHEGSHLTVGNLSHTACATVLAQAMMGEFFVEVMLDFGRMSLQKDKSADGGHGDFADAPPLLGRAFDGGVNEEWAVVLFELGLKSSDLLMMYEKVTPRC